MVSTIYLIFSQKCKSFCIIHKNEDCIIFTVYWWKKQGVSVHFYTLAVFMYWFCGFFGGSCELCDVPVIINQDHVTSQVSKYYYPWRMALKYLAFVLVTFETDCFEINYITRMCHTNIFLSQEIKKFHK